MALVYRGIIQDHIGIRGRCRARVSGLGMVSHMASEMEYNGIFFLARKSSGLSCWRQ